MRIVHAADMPETRQVVTVSFRGRQLVAVFPPGPAGLLRPGRLAEVR